MFDAIFFIKGLVTDFFLFWGWGCWRFVKVHPAESLRKCFTFSQCTTSFKFLHYSLLCVQFLKHQKILKKKIFIFYKLIYKLRRFQCGISMSDCFLFIISYSILHKSFTKWNEICSRKKKAFEILTFKINYLHSLKLK